MNANRYRPKGVPISKKFHFARLLFFFIATPLLTWYGHQFYTNPYKYHTVWQLNNVDGVPVLHIYEESLKGVRDNLYFTLSKYDSTFSIDSGSIESGTVLSLKSENLLETRELMEGAIENQPDQFSKISFNSSSISVVDSSISITNSDTTIVLLFKDEHNNRRIKSHDILFSTVESREIMLKQRENLSPKLTIWETDIKTLKDLPKNIFIWNGISRHYIIKRGRNFRVIDPKK